MFRTFSLMKKTRESSSRYCFSLRSSFLMHSMWHEEGSQVRRPRPWRGKTDEVMRRFRTAWLLDGLLDGL
jgi:hypothetical protein